ncbi:MAG: hypothetical protein Q8O93_02020 [bacterium]|nr:hypothetical protein [bacterium]
MARLFFAISIFLTPAVMPLIARAEDSAFIKGLKTTGESGAGYEAIKGGPVQYLAKFIGGILNPAYFGVLGLLFLFYGGFVWMKARGNEQEVERAKSTVINTIIALAVIFGAWAIINLVNIIWQYSAAVTD